MIVDVVYMDMQFNVKAFSVQNEDGSYTVVVNKKYNLTRSIYDIINDYLCTDNYK